MADRPARVGSDHPPTTGTGVVERLWDLAAELLAIDPALLRTRPHAGRSFVALGGSSMLAMRLVARADERCGVRLALGDLLEDVSLAAVLAAARVRDDPPAAADAAPGSVTDGPRPDLGTSGVLPPVAGQSGMWIAERSVGQMYRLCFVAFLDGPLRAGRLEQAIHRTVGRHDGLRVRFLTTPDGGVARQVTAGPPPVLERVDTGAANDFEEVVESLATTESGRPFRFEDGPPLRFLLATGGADRTALITITHHLLLDAWAIGLLLREILARYDGYTGGPVPRCRPAVPLGVQTGSPPADRSGASGGREHPWEPLFAEVPPVVELPADQPRRAIRGPDGRRLAFRIGEPVAVSIDATCQRSGVTPFVVLLAAFGLTIARHVGRTRLLVGVPTAGRGSRPEHDLVAQCARVVPVAITVDDRSTPVDFLRHVRRSLTTSMDQDMPTLDVLAPRFAPPGDLSRNPLVQAVCGRYADVVPWHLRTRELDVRIKEMHTGGSPMDVTVAFHGAGPGYPGTLEYSHSLWHDAEAEAFLASYLAGVADLTRVERLAEARAIPPAAGERPAPPAPAVAAHSVNELLRAQAARTPGLVAVRHGGQELTYQRLAAAVDGYTRQLRDADVGPGDRVVLTSDRSLGEVVAALGVLRCGAIVAAVAPDASPRVLTRLLTSFGPTAAIGAGRSAARLAAVGVTMIPVWTSDPATAQPSPVEATTPGPAVGAGSDACVVASAGTAGTPRWVRVPHRALVHLASRGTVPGGCGPGARFLHHTPLSCAAGWLELLAPLAHGGTVEIHAGTPLGPAELDQVLRDRRITGLRLSVPALRRYATWCAGPEAAPGSPVRVVLAEGGGLTRRDLSGLWRAHPAAEVWHGYHCAESLSIATLHRITPPTVTGAAPEGGTASTVLLHSGRPGSGLACQILDEDGLLVPPGAMGELCLSGAGLASTGAASPVLRTGDLARIDRSGRLHIGGRTGDPADPRGYRARPEQVAAVLRAHPAVADAVILTRRAPTGLPQTTAACLPRDGHGIDLPELRAWAAAALPRWQLPDAWAVLAELPLTDCGAIHRGQLRAAVGW
ncbi:MAG: AMP-binding protein [Actinobacteria bacterium]|nr:AMP-binding protein [Actinomycetota bacterium]